MITSKIYINSCSKSQTAYQTRGILSTFSFLILNSDEESKIKCAFCSLE